MPCSLLIAVFADAKNPRADLAWSTFSRNHLSDLLNRIRESYVGRVFPAQITTAYHPTAAITMQVATFASALGKTLRHDQFRCLALSGQFTHFTGERSNWSGIMMAEAGPLDACRTRGTIKGHGDAQAFKGAVFPRS